MSRIGKLPIPIPDGVQVNIQGQQVSVKGPKGALDLTANSAIQVQVDDRQIVCRRGSDVKAHKALHGLTRALIANMVRGVQQGFERKLELELVGVGYRASMMGTGKPQPDPRLLAPPSSTRFRRGIAIEVKDQTQITVSGIDKQLVGSVAAKIRGFRPPEPYKGKGVKYAEERIRRKAGKAGAK